MKPKVLLIDIETAPMLGYVWSLWQNDVALNQLHSDWHLLSFAAKWLDKKEVIYSDQRSERDISNDKKLLQKIWKLLDAADVVITQNGISFDIKKLNARFILNGMKPPSSFKNIDTKRIASKKFAFTSNKLEYLTKNLCTKYKKLTARKFSGFSLWTACLAKNVKAFNEMKKYNIMDVLSLEELYKKLIPWDSSINFSLYDESEDHTCTCGSTNHKKNGYKYTGTAKYQRYVCTDCGKETRGRVNLLSKEKKASLKV